MTEFVLGTPEQLPMLKAIEDACFSDPWTEEALAGAMNDTDCFFLVAKQDTNPVGYCLVHSLYEQADLYSIAVHPGFRRMGIAKSLLEQGIVWARGAGAEVIFLEVRESNTAAKCLYEKIGFTAIATRKKYYIAPVEDAVIMEKTL